jgi:hypothetical protein
MRERNSPAGSCPLPGRTAIGSRATAEAGIGQTMKNFVQRPLWAGVVASVLGLALQGCNATSSPRGSVSAPSPALNWHDQAARLIRALDLSGRLQDAARDYVVGQMARGVAPKPALERWIAEQRERGAVIRCKPEVSATDECVART